MLGSEHDGKQGVTLTVYWDHGCINDVFSAVGGTSSGGELHAQVMPTSEVTN